MKIKKTRIKGVVEIIRTPIRDSRGLFSRMFCDDSLQKYLHLKKIKQINHSISCVFGSIRGMHLQLKEHAETKIISCIVGKIYDVALDLRRGSETFLQWDAIELNAEKHNSFVIPEGVAHGFQCLSNRCEMIYLHTANYCVESEFSVNVLDPMAAIEWPLAVTEMSEKDRSVSFLEMNYKGFSL